MEFEYYATFRSKIYNCKTVEELKAYIDKEKSDSQVGNTEINYKLKIDELFTNFDTTFIQEMEESIDYSR